MIESLTRDFVNAMNILNRSESRKGIRSCCLANILRFKMSGMLKGLGLVGAGAYGYHTVENSDHVQNIKGVLGLLDSSRSNSAYNSSGSSAGSGGGEVWWK